MYACFSQSTSISLPSTSTNGFSTCPIHVGSMVNERGIAFDAVNGTDVELADPANKLAHDEERLLLPILKPPTSTIFRIAMMRSMSQSWKRSTISAQVIWNRFSFSNLLNTVPLISTNWLDRRSVRRALEYELTATLSVMTW